MRVLTASVPVTSISPTQIESLPSEPIVAVTNNHSRTRLIETIGRNVMAWTRWSGGQRDNSNQSSEEK